jgi:hypothetical protein
MLNYRRVKFEKPQIYYEIHYKCRGGNPAKKPKIFYVILLSVGIKKEMIL